MKNTQPIFYDVQGIFACHVPQGAVVNDDILSDASRVSYEVFVESETMHVIVYDKQLPGPVTDEEGPSPALEMSLDVKDLCMLLYRAGYDVTKRAR